MRIDGVPMAAGCVDEQILRDQQRGHPAAVMFAPVESLRLHIRPGAIGVLVVLPRFLGQMPELLGNLKTLGDHHAQAQRRKLAGAVVVCGIRRVRWEHVKKQSPGLSLGFHGFEQEVHVGLRRSVLGEVRLMRLQTRHRHAEA